MIIKNHIKLNYYLPLQIKIEELLKKVDLLIKTPQGQEDKDFLDKIKQHEDFFKASKNNTRM